MKTRRNLRLSVLVTFVCVAGACGGNSLTEERSETSSSQGTGGGKSDGKGKAAPNASIEEPEAADEPNGNVGPNGERVIPEDGTDDAQPAVRLISEADCKSFCETFVGNKCQEDAAFDMAQCEEDCFGPASLPAECGDLLWQLYSCIETKLPITCRSGNQTAIVCGPCDQQLKALANECDIELECVFN